MAFAGVTALGPGLGEVTDLVGDVETGDLIIASRTDSTGRRVTRAHLEGTLLDLGSTEGANRDFRMDVDGDLKSDFLSVGAGEITLSRPSISAETTPAYIVPSGCSVQQLASGSFVPVRWSRGRDLVISQTCSGISELVVLRSLAQIRLTFRFERVGGAKGVRLLVALHGKDDPSIPTGELTLYRSGKEIAKLNIKDGLVALPLTGLRRRMIPFLYLAYSGDNHFAAVAEKIRVAPGVQTQVRVRVRIDLGLG